MAAERSAGVHAILRRYGRRVPATYLLSKDVSAPIVPRLLARALSGYERARVREVVMILFDELPAFDGPLIWLVRRGIFALARRPRGDDDPACDLVVPYSGRAGNLLALLVWAGVLAGLWSIFVA